MQRRKETKAEKRLAAKMKKALEQRFNSKIPEPRVLSQFRKETLRIEENEKSS